MPERPLEGLRVLELARVLAGPWIGQTLADLGADVIKVESPEGDETRGWGPPFAEDGSAAYFHAANRGKRAIRADFRDAGELARTQALAARADVVVENFKVGGLARFGLDYASVAAGNPRVVYCSVTGFGQDGPRSAEPGYDFLVQAMGGLMEITGEPDGPPQKVGVAITDLFTGLYGVIAIQAALALRARTGRGQHIDMALFDCQLAMLANQATNHLIGGREPRRLGNAHPNIAPYQLFEAADGPLIVACGNDGQFARLCRALGLAFHEDPRFAENRGRVANREGLDAALRPAFAARSRAEALALMAGAGVPAGPINSVSEAFAEPQAVARGMIRRIGGSAAPRCPIRFSETELAADRPPPRPDEHGDTIRAALATGADWPGQ